MAAGDRKWGAGDREKAAGDQKGPGRNFLRDGPEKTGTEPNKEAPNVPDRRAGPDQKEKTNQKGTCTQANKAIHASNGTTQSRHHGHGHLLLHR